MQIRDLFEEEENTLSTHDWILGNHNDEQREPLVNLLAEKIVEHKCRGCNRLFEAWKNVVENGAVIDEKSQIALRVFLRSTFARPGEEVCDDHLQGAISEYLWFFLIQENLIDDELVCIEPPGFSPTDSGGDGLVIFKNGLKDLGFRLWEIKKYTGDNDASSSINKAYKQLNEKSLEYLARYTVTGQEKDDEDLKDFYGDLIDLWIDADPKASPGVSVSTSKDSLPTNSFDKFPEKFPDFLNPKRFVGLLIAIGDFANFCEKVKERVWIGL